jgi:hypothetical protein
MKFYPKTISAVVAAAAIAGALTIISGASDTVSASVNTGKSDRLDIRAVGTKCSEQAWPFYETNCVRDRREAMGQVNKEVRVVVADRATVEISAQKRVEAAAVKRVAEAPAPAKRTVK